MAHIRGLWAAGCLALAVLLSLVRSQHGKGAWRLGPAGRLGCGRMGRGLLA